MNHKEGLIWQAGISYTFQVEREGEVNFQINGHKYRLRNENGWFQLTKNGGGYKDEFYGLGIKDRHTLADNLVQYVMEDLE